MDSYFLVPSATWASNPHLSKTGKSKKRDEIEPFYLGNISVETNFSMETMETSIWTIRHHVAHNKVSIVSTERLVFTLYVAFYACIETFSETHRAETIVQFHQSLKQFQILQFVVDKQIERELGLAIYHRSPILSFNRRT